LKSVFPDEILRRGLVRKETQSDQTRLVELTADIAAAYVSHNPVPIKMLGALIEDVHAVLKVTAGGVISERTKQLIPAVPIKKSVTPDYIISLEDGKKFKSLKRHLTAHYGLTPEGYRAKWGLPADYPMTAPNYSKARSALAKKLGLGRKAEKPAPPKRMRKKLQPATYASADME
jgi:predicted transcriptional regulator